MKNTKQQITGMAIYINMLKKQINELKQLISLLLLYQVKN